MVKTQTETITLEPISKQVEINVANTLNEVKDYYNQIKNAMKKNDCIHELRKAGFKVRLYHYRYQAVRLPLTHELHYELCSARDLNGPVIHPNGGKTEMTLTLPNGSSFVSESKCNLKDSFSYRVAYIKCLGRIVAQIEKQISGA